MRTPVAEALGLLQAKSYALACLLGMSVVTLVFVTRFEPTLVGPVMVSALASFAFAHICVWQSGGKATLLVSLLTLAALPFCGQLPVLGIVAVALVAIGLLAATERQVVRRNLTIRALSDPFLALFALLGAYIGVMAIGPNITVGLLTDRETDIPFQLALAGMIKTYWRVSTGLNGLVPLNYHWGSHALLAGLSQCFNVPALVAYAASPILVLPTLMLVAFRMVMVFQEARDAVAMTRLRVVFASSFLFLASCIVVPFFVIQQTNYVRDPSILWSLLTFALSLLVLAGMITNPRGPEPFRPRGRDCGGGCAGRRDRAR